MPPECPPSTALPQALASRKTMPNPSRSTTRDCLLLFGFGALSTRRSGESMSLLRSNTTARRHLVLDRAARSTSLARTPGQVRRAQFRPDGGGAPRGHRSRNLCAFLGAGGRRRRERRRARATACPPALADRHRSLQGSLDVGMFALGALVHASGSARPPPASLERRRPRRDC